MAVILGVLTFLNQGDNFAAAPLIVQIARDFDVEVSKVALSQASYLMSFGIFTLFFGPLADKYGKARVINTGAFLTAIFCSLGAFSYSLNYLIVIRALNGMLAATIIPVAVSLIGETNSNSINSKGDLGKVFGMMFLGGATAPLIVGVLSYYGSWRMVYIFYGLAQLIVSLIMLKTIPKPKGLSELSIIQSYIKAYANKNLLKTVSICFLIGFSIMGGFTYVGEFVKVVTGYNIFFVGLILTFFGWATVFGGRKTSYLKDKYGNKFLAYSGILGLIAWGLMGFWNSSILIAVSLFGVGLSFIFIHPVIVALSQQLMPDLRGTVMSLVSLYLFVGGAVGAYINGIILDKYGFAALFLLAGFFIFTAGIVSKIVLSSVAKRI